MVLLIRASMLEDGRRACHQPLDEWPFFRTNGQDGPTKRPARQQFRAPDEPGDVIVGLLARLGG